MGKRAKVGATNVSSNGYHYTRTKEGWRLTHHIIAEKKYGKRINTDEYRVMFKDGDRTNLTEDNVVLVEKVNGRKQRIERLKEQILALELELEELSNS